MRLPRFVRPFGASALLLEWEQRIDPAINASVHTYTRALRKLAGVQECVPAYASLLVTYTGGAAAAYTLRESIFALRLSVSDESSTLLHELPVCYGGIHGPDMLSVRELTGLTEERIIELHTTTIYQVYFLGFQPGFGFLGELDAALEIARRATPRTRVPAGSVGLAGRQTGIYPSDSPGGWQLIGRCPLPLLRAGADATRLRAGDRVQFYSVSPEAYRNLHQNPPPWPVR